MAIASRRQSTSWTLIVCCLIVLSTRVKACMECDDSKSSEALDAVALIDMATSGDRVELTGGLLDAIAGNASYAEQNERPNDLVDQPDRVLRVQSKKADNPTPLFEIRPSPSKGLGIFALRPIPSGTTIFVEPPIMRVPMPFLLPGVGFHLSSMIPSLEASFALLSPSEQETVLSLHDHRFPSEEEDGTSRLLTIFRSNAYNTGEDEIGLFPKVARINHSCRPNAGNWWSAGMGRRVIYAARDVQAGEEITVSYIPLLKDTEERQQRLVQYGFRCGCKACLDGKESERRSDRRRVKIGEVLGDLELFRDETLDGAVPVPVKLSGKKSDGKTREEKTERAILKAVKLVDWVEAEDGLGDYKARVFRLAAVLNMRRGWLGAAEGWARKELGLWDWAERESEEVKGVMEFIYNLKKAIWS